MIRQATINDINHCVEIGKKFWHESHASNFFGSYDPDHVRSTLKQFMSMDLIIGWVAFDSDFKFKGGLIALKDNAFWKDVTILKEMAWYIDPELRGSITSFKLYKAMEKYAKENGIPAVIMSRIRGVPNFDKLDQFYKKNNFSPIEDNYIKML